MKIQSRPPVETGPTAHTLDQLQAMGRELLEDFFDPAKHASVLVGMLGALKALGHIRAFAVHVNRYGPFVYVILNNDPSTQGFQL